MQYCLEAVSEKKYYNIKTGLWVKEPKDATLWRETDMTRFAWQLYVSRRLEPVIWHGVLFMSAEFKMSEQLRLK